MATVRMSQALKDAVVSRAKSVMHQILLKTISPLCPELGAEIADGQLWEFCDQLNWGENIDLRGKLPSKWMSQCDYFDLNLRLTSGEGLPRLSRNTISLSVRKPGSNQFLSRPGTSRYGHDVFVNEGDAALPPFITELMQRARAFGEAEYQHKQKEEALAKQLCSVLNAHGSLNAAVKAFPNIKLYVPQEYLDRMEQKVERIESAKVEKTVPVVDEGLLASIGAIGQMISA